MVLPPPCFCPSIIVIIHYCFTLEEADGEFQTTYLLSKGYPPNVRSLLGKREGRGGDGTLGSCIRIAGPVIMLHAVIEKPGGSKLIDNWEAGFPFAAL